MSSSLREMEASNTECGVCFNSYDEKERRPLVLPCSHSFCQTCLEKMAADEKKMCSFCRQSWDRVQIQDLLCCFQLIPSRIGRSSSKEEDPQKCLNHNTDISLWCESCNALICVKCLRLTHKDCQWVLLEEKCDKSLNLCENLLTELTSIVPRNSKALQTVDRYMSTLQKVRDDLVTWQLNAEKELSDWPTFDGVAQTAKEAVGLHQKAMALSSVMRQVPVDRATVQAILGNAPQETEDVDSRQLPASLAPLADLSLGEAGPGDAIMDPSSAPSAPSLVDVASLPEEEGTIHPESDTVLPKGGVWSISDVATVTEACRGLRLYLLPPSGVKIKWSFGDRQELLDLLSLVKMTPCFVTVKLLDCFLTPVSRSLAGSGDKRSVNSSTNGDEEEVQQLPTPPARTLQTTHSRIDALLIPDHRCVLTEFSGHLDAESLRKLPKTLKTLGLAMVDKEDMATVKLLVETERNNWIFREEWSFLSKLHLSFVRHFESGFWNLDKKKVKGNSEFSSYVMEGLELSLHFPNLEPKSLSWFKRILTKLTGSSKDKSFVKRIFFFGYQLSTEKLKSVLKDCKLEHVALYHPQEATGQDQPLDAEALRTDL